MVFTRISLAVFCLCCTTYPALAASFSSTGNMSVARGGGTATLLSNGKVLICDGYSVRGEVLASVSTPLGGGELYDLRTGAFTPVGDLPAGIYTATLLLDGRVLLSGYNVTTSFVPLAFVYDPASASFTATGTTASARIGPASLLPDGRVLIAGGGVPVSGDTTTDIYDPASGTFSPGPPMVAPTYGRATTLADGRILMTGAAPQIFNPATGAFTATGTMLAGSGAPQTNYTPIPGRQGHTATLLPNGKVLVTGGNTAILFVPGITQSGAGCTQPLATSSAELYDPANGTFSYTGPMTAARVAHQAVLLDNGKVLVTGGYVDQCNGIYVGSLGLERTVLATAEIYDPATGTFSPAGSMNAVREDHRLTRLANGQVLVSGGADGWRMSARALSSAEIYSATDPRFTALPAPGALTVSGASTITVTNSGPTGNALTVTQASISNGYTTTGLPITNLPPGSSSTFGVQCVSGPPGTLVVGTNENPPRQYTYDLTCQPGVARFVVALPPSAMSGSPVSFTVTAVDSAGNVVSTYGGTVSFTSSDTAATLPAQATLVNGMGTFTATFRTGGTVILNVVDSAQSAVSGSASIVTVTTAIPALSPRLLLALLASLLLLGALRLS